jgi:predicted metalloendopeptidase
LTATPIDDWKIYLRWHLLNAAAPGLPEKFVAEDFEFGGKTLTGAKEIQPRWKRCVQATDRSLGEALGRSTCKHFPPEAKARAREMVRNLIAALRDDLQTLPGWEQTHVPGNRETGSFFGIKIGYTDKWRDYSALKIDRKSYADNQMRSAEFDVARVLDKIGKPGPHGMGHDAAHRKRLQHSSMNEIVFPAGIMQPPFYDPKADDAVNYGGMGAVIGHEITHGFDDHGSKFDLNGNLKDWWSADDLKNFRERAACVSDQFDGATRGRRPARKTVSWFWGKHRRSRADRRSPTPRMKNHRRQATSIGQRQLHSRATLLPRLGASLGALTSGSSIRG